MGFNSTHAGIFFSLQIITGSKGKEWVNKGEGRGVRDSKITQICGGV
jgi:hypothetical protein